MIQSPTSNRISFLRIWFVYWASDVDRISILAWGNEIVPALLCLQYYDVTLNIKVVAIRKLKRFNLYYIEICLTVSKIFENSRKVTWLTNPPSKSNHVYCDWRNCLRLDSLLSTKKDPWFNSHWCLTFSMTTEHRIH